MYQERQLGQTNLWAINVLYQDSQSSLLSEEYSENVTLIVLKDKVTGKTGHVYHEYATDKRDVEEENFYTDNPSLFQDNPCVEAYYITELSCSGPDSTPTHRNMATDALINACLENQLEYTELTPDADTDTHDGKCWGLHPVTQPAT